MHITVRKKRLVYYTAETVRKLYNCQKKTIIHCTYNCQNTDQFIIHLTVRELPSCFIHLTYLKPNCLYYISLSQTGQFIVFKLSKHLHYTTIYQKTDQFTRWIDINSEGQVQSNAQYQCQQHLGFIFYGPVINSLSDRLNYQRL